MTDTRLLTLLILAFSLFLCITKVQEPDTFWHIRTGQSVIKDHHIPTTDVFTLNAVGKPWVAHSWLTEVLFSVAYSAGGFEALTIFKAIVISAAFVTLYRTCVLSGCPPAFASFMVICFLLAGSFRFSERPHIFTILLLAVYARLLVKGKSRPVSTLYVLPLLSLVWANLHAGVIFGILLLMIHAGCGIVTSSLPGKSPARTGNRPRAKHLLIVTVLSLAATFINPQGARLYSFFMAQSHVSEYASIKEFFPLVAADTMIHGIFAALMILIVIVTFRRRNLEEIAVTLVFGGLALAFRRMLPEFFSAAGAALACASWDLASRLRALNSKRVRSVMGFFPFVFAVSSGFWVIHTDVIQLHGLGVLNTFYPASAIDFIRSQGLLGRMFNSANFGGAVILLGYPDIRPYLDTRNELHEETLIRLHSYRSSPDLFASFLDSNTFDMAMVEPYQKYITGGLFPRVTWALVYWDDIAMVLIRRTKKSEKIIREFEYTTVNPENAYESLPQILADKSRKESAERELIRCLRTNPDTSRARILLGHIYSSESRWMEAEREFLQAVKIQPFSLTANYEAALFYSQRGEYRAAVPFIHKTVSLAGAYKIRGPALDRLYEEEKMISAMSRKSMR